MPRSIGVRSTSILLAFEKKANSVDDLRSDETLACLLEHSSKETPIASVVLSPSTQLLDAFLEEHTILALRFDPGGRPPRSGGSDSRQHRETRQTASR